LKKDFEIWKIIYLMNAVLMLMKDTRKPFDVQF
jgi:hypothetical protein